MSVKREKIHFATVDELLGAPVEKEGTVEIRVDQIFPFENHPFKVVDDDKMDELVESIKANGVMSPIIVRPDDEGTYEMISGHRRLHASQRAGLTTIPAIIKELTDDEATILMVDANIQRDEILPSERAYSLKMKMDAMKRQGYRSDLTPRLQGEKNINKNMDDIEKDENTSRLQGEKYKSINSNRESWTSEIVGKDLGLKGRTVQRYLRLTELDSGLLDLVDKKRLGVNIAETISFFDKDVQKWICQYIHDNGFIRQEQVNALKEYKNLENLTQKSIIAIMNSALPQKKESGKVVLSERVLAKYFPPHFTAKEKENVIIGLLEKWVAEGGLTKS